MTNKTVKKFRAEFRKKHAHVNKVINLILKGKTSSEIANKLTIPMPSVRTIRGNLTRGYYLPYVQVKDGKTTGICRF